MSRRHTNIGTSPTPPIPTGYTALNYIQSTGTQYIDTGVHSGQKTNVVMDMTPTNLSGGIFIGWMSPSNNYCRSYLACGNTNKFSLGYGDGYNAGYWNSSAYTANMRYSIEYQTLSGNHWFKINNTTIFTSSDASTYITTLNFTIFARNVDGTVNAQSKCKLHEVYLSIDDTLCFHGVPVLRTSDSKPGLWDFVSESFFTNNGTGEFSYA